VDRAADVALADPAAEAVPDLRAAARVPRAVAVAARAAAVVAARVAGADAS
jgi:hypothetical protein